MIFVLWVLAGATAAWAHQGRLARARRVTLLVRWALSLMLVTGFGYACFSP
ncbi:MAG: hypothetical protein ACYS9X_20085 [Planctomycetota bacterium]|jgi:hypothetical protein